MNHVIKIFLGFLAHRAAQLAVELCLGRHALAFPELGAKTLQLSFFLWCQRILVFITQFPESLAFFLTIRIPFFFTLKDHALLDRYRVDVARLQPLTREVANESIATMVSEHPFDLPFQILTQLCLAGQTK